MKEKILLIILGIIILSGCSNKSRKLVCTKTEEYKGIETEYVITYTFKKGMADKSVGIATMNFKDDKAALAYYETYDGDKELVKLEDNRIIFETDEKFTSENTSDRKTIKDNFEDLEYECR